MKPILLNLSDCRSIGDIICSTPTLKNLYESYGKKIIVSTHFPEIFEGNPYVEKTYSHNALNADYVNDNFIVHTTFDNIGKKNERGVEMKHNRMDIRQFHAINLGFMLSKDEMQCEFYPKPYQDISNLPEKYVLIHPVQNWPNRTWTALNWMQLTKKLNDLNINVVSIGKDSSETGFFDIQKPTFNFEIDKGLNLINKTSLSQAWHLIQNSICFITMDSGLLHLAGTTDANIIMLGSAINPEFRKPYRNGDQNYKLDYIVGSCELSCASNMKHGVNEWGSIQGVPPLIGCLENKKTFECHPSLENVYDKIIKLIDGQ